MRAIKGQGPSDGSKPLASPKREVFCQLFAAGETRGRAYEVAGFTSRTPEKAGSDLLKKPEVAARVAALVAGAPRQRKALQTDKARSTWNAVPAPEEPAPATLRVNRGDQWTESPVVAAWAYRDAGGQLWAYDCRIEFEKPDGGTGKDIIPMTYRVNTETGETKWRQGSLPEPRVLYGTELLAANPDAQVVITEGCKAAEAARRLLAGTGLVVITWMGGCKAVDIDREAENR